MLLVQLSHEANPDIKHGYWQDPTESGKPVYVPVTDITHASATCRQFIERNGLGGGNWTGGAVFMAGEKGDREQQIANISYNGRAWGMAGNELVGDATTAPGAP